MGNQFGKTGRKVLIKLSRNESKHILQSIIFYIFIGCVTTLRPVYKARAIGFPKKYFT